MASRPVDTQVYQFTIQMKRNKPRIWRRIQVPSTYSFWDLHVAIQNAMGWDDYHLHKFVMKHPTAMRTYSIGRPDEFINKDDKKTKIAEFFTAANPKAYYEYDFGKSWEHEIIFEKILPAEDGIKYPICIAGKRACIPEDGVTPRGYDPEKFDHKEVVFDDPLTHFDVMGDFYK